MLESGWGEIAIILDKKMRKCLTGNVTRESRPESGEEASNRLSA